MQRVRGLQYQSVSVERRKNVGHQNTNSDLLIITMRTGDMALGEVDRVLAVLKAISQDGLISSF